MQVNKNYNEFIKDDKFYKELKELNFKEEPPIMFINWNSFLKACYYGYLKVAKYFYKRDGIDIHKQNELAFRV